MTWYYVPFTSAPATEASSSLCDSPASPPEPWLTLSGTPTQRPLSSPAWKRRTWIRRLSGLTSPPSTVQRGADEWISSLPVSPANPSPQRDSSVELTTSVGSGLPSDGSSVTWDPASCSWRTSPSLFDSGYLTSSPTLPSSGSMRNGVCSLRPRLAHRTSVNGSGYWRTPRASEGFRGTDPERDGRTGGPSLMQSVGSWSTPVATWMTERGPKARLPFSEGGSSSKPTLIEQARQWPTPTATDAKASGGAELGTNVTLTDAAVRLWPTPTAHDPKDLGAPPSQLERKSPGLASIAATSGPPVATTPTDGESGPPKVDLNPRFVEALMGVPQNWLTPSTSVETGSYQRWLRLHSLNSHDASAST